MYYRGQFCTQQKYSVNLAMILLILLFDFVSSLCSLIYSSLCINPLPNLSHCTTWTPTFAWKFSSCLDCRLYLGSTQPLRLQFITFNKSLKTKDTSGL